MESDPAILKVLEALNYLSTCGLLVVAIIGLKQLRITKDLARKNAQRESYRIASEQLRHYRETVLPLTGELKKIIDAPLLKLVKESSVVKTKEDPVIHVDTQNEETIAKLRKSFKPLADFFNAQEEFATYFTSKLGDEKIAYKAVGQNYCDNVGRYKPFIKAMEGKYYRNTMELYDVWNERLKSDSLSLQKQKIEKKMSSLKKASITPLGTED